MLGPVQSTGSRKALARMPDHGPLTVGAPGTLTSMMSPLWRGKLANMVVTSSYLAVHTTEPSRRHNSANC